MLRNKVVIVFWTFILFIILGTGIFNYYTVNESKDVGSTYIVKEVEWNDFLDHKVENRISIRNEKNDSFDEYKLMETGYGDVKTSTKEIIKVVSYKNVDNIEKSNFPPTIKHTDGSYLQISKVIPKANIETIDSWHDKLDEHVVIYDSIINADFSNIPKEISFKNAKWYLLTDKVEFNKMLDNYCCVAPYFRVKRVEESTSKVVSYNVGVVYTGKSETKGGNVHLKYKLINQVPEKHILPMFSKKMIIISIIIFVSLISIFILIERNILKSKSQ